ncbi:MAG: dTMP kinase [Candidatus Methanomethylophilaceae archaeon]
MVGLFIVFEGIDGSGKSSVCRTVKKNLESEGMDVIVTAEPTDSEIGRMIRKGGDFTPETEALLFVADRACHTVEIKKWVAQGRIVLCDRYYASTLAYQAASLGEDADLEWLTVINEKVSVEPDLTFLLDIDPVSGLDRVGRRGGKSRFEHLEYQKRVRENYMVIAKKRGFTVIDASKDRKAVASEVLTEIKRRLE